MNKGNFPYSFSVHKNWLVGRSGVKKMKTSDRVNFIVGIVLCVLISYFLFKGKEDESTFFKVCGIISGSYFGLMAFIISFAWIGVECEEQS